MGDSNPRYGFSTVCRFSKPVPSTTRPTLQVSKNFFLFTKGGKFRKKEIREWIDHHQSESIFKTASAASAPLFPNFPPARFNACSNVTVVSTPNATGLLLASDTSMIPCETTLHI